MKVASLPFPPEATRENARGSPRHAPPPRRSWPVTILGLPCENLSAAEAMLRIGEMIASRRSHRVVTADLALWLEARREPELQRSIASADLVLCESTALLCASWCFGNPLPERVPASALRDRALRLAAARAYRVFWFEDGVADAAAVRAQLARAYPGLPIVGAYAPDRPAAFDAAELRARVRAARPDLLIASLSSAAGRKWLAAQQSHLDIPVTIECRAPTGPRRAPSRRWERAQAALVTLRDRARRAITAVPDLARQWSRMSHPFRRNPPTAAVLSLTHEWLDLDAGIDLTRAGCDANPALWRLADHPAVHCSIDVSKVRWIDATGLAVLARCQRTLQRSSRQLVLISPNPTVRQALAAAQLTLLFQYAPTARDARLLAPPLEHAPARGITRSLAWCGEIIQANSEDVWQMTSDYVRTFAANDATLVIVDLSRLRFMDSHGAGLMLRVKRWSRDLKVEVLFTHAQPQVLDLLRVMRLDLLLLEGSQ